MTCTACLSVFMPKAVNQVKQSKGPKKILWLALIGGMIILLVFLVAANNILNPHPITSPITAVCVGQTNFTCNNPLFNSQQNLSFSMSEITGATLYNTELACSLYNTTVQMPSPIYSPLMNTTLKNGQQVEIELPCYIQEGKLTSLILTYTVHSMEFYMSTIPQIHHYLLRKIHGIL